MAANIGRAGGVAGHRLKDSALERRRPSKRQTTVRSFSVVRSWRNQENSSSDPNSHNKKTVSVSRVSKASQPLSSTSSKPATIPETAASAVWGTASSFMSSTVVPSQRSARHSIRIPRDSPTPIILTSPRALSVSLGELPTQAVTEASPDSIVISSPQAQTLLPASSLGELHVSASTTPAMTDKRPSAQKTPCSGPGTYKGPGRPKRKRVAAASTSTTSDRELDADYRENKFVRLFNADQGRSKSVKEITDLDVVLTSIERIALDCRNETESGIGKQAIKEFFIQVRKILTDRIDSYKEHQLLKSDLRKAKSRVTKYRKELLAIHQQSSKVKAKLEKSVQQPKPSEKQKALEEISNFMTDLEALEKQSRETVSSSKLSKKDYASPSNLPSILSEAYSLVTAGRHLGSINDSLQQWLSKTTKS